MANLTNKAMIVKLHVSAWTAKKFDKTLSREITSAHGAAEEAARVNKNLFPFEAPSYQKIHQIVGEARRAHDYETLPWDDDSGRVLLAANYMTYAEKFRKFKNDFETAVPEFLDDYPTLQEWSHQKLNGIWKAEDFPPLAKLKKKFKFSTEVLPIPDEADFRVAMQLEDLADCKRMIQQEQRSKIAVAMREPYHRLYEVVASMAEKLNDPNATFHKTLVSKVASLTDHVLTALNLDDDQDLMDIGAKIKAGLCQFEPDLLRDNEAIREKVGNRAREVMADLAAYMGGN